MSVYTKALRNLAAFLRQHPEFDQGEVGYVSFATHSDTSLNIHLSGSSAQEAETLARLEEALGEASWVDWTGVTGFSTRDAENLLGFKQVKIFIHHERSAVAA